MARQHFDVVVLGKSLGALAAGALLAKSGYRVLAVGHGDLDAFYTYEGFALRRRIFLCPTLASPVLEQIVSELNLGPALRRRGVAQTDLFHWHGLQTFMPMSLDRHTLFADVARHCRMPLHLVQAQHELLSEFARDSDAALRDIGQLPARGFFRSRSVESQLRKLPYGDARADSALAMLLGEFAPQVLRMAMQLSAAYPVPSAFAALRLHSLWMRSSLQLTREAQVSEVFAERIVAQGGVVAYAERAQNLEVVQGKITSFDFGDRNARVACEHVILSAPLRAALEMAHSGQVLDRAHAQIASAGRAIVNFVVAPQGMPQLASRYHFIDTGDAVLGTLFCEVEVYATHTVVAAEATLAGGVPPDFRERVAAEIARVFPFLPRALLLVDSPHDGRPLFDYRSGHREHVERVLLRSGGARMDVEPMLPLHYVPVASPQHGLMSEPIETPIGNAWYCGDAVVPGLGQEGLWLAARSVAAVVRSKLPEKERLR
jgi:hypothetical protein